ncbi:retrovirus-related pol polyprotein from transposon TNT 1-94 [Tanacetum coccineum]
MVNILGEREVGVTTRSRVRDSEAASTHECIYVNFFFEIEPKKTLVPTPYSKTIIGAKWIFRNKMEENGVDIINKARLVAHGYRQEEGIDYDEILHQLQDQKASEYFLLMLPTWVLCNESPNHVCKMDKALYELKQAPIAWYQANPKESHLVSVKRIFRYLKGTPNLGLWYPKESSFDLKAYSDSDNAGCNLDRKSSGGCQILGGKLEC